MVANAYQKQVLYLWSGNANKNKSKNYWKQTPIFIKCPTQIRRNTGTNNQSNTRSTLTDHRTKYNAGIDEEEESLDKTPQAAWQVSFCKYKYVTFDALRTYSKLFIDLIEVELKPLACGRWRKFACAVPSMRNGVHAYAVALLISQLYLCPQVHQNTIATSCTRRCTSLPWHDFWHVIFYSC
jgi:hypothetical protein